MSSSSRTDFRSVFPPADRAGRIVFGLVPQRDDESTRAQLNELCTAIGAAAGVPVVSHRSPTPEALASAFRSSRIQLCWAGAALLLIRDEMAGAVPLLSSVRSGVAVYHSALFSLRESSIRSLRDLKGSRAAWVATTSASGYLVPRLSLARRGLDVVSLFAEEKFYGGHLATARAVFEGRADVGAVYAIYEQGDPKAALAKSGFLDADAHRAVRLIDVSGPIPADLIAAAPTVPAELRTRIADAIERVSQTPAGARAIHDLMGIEGFRRFTAASLTELRALLEAAKRAGLVQSASE